MSTNYLAPNTDAIMEAAQSLTNGDTGAALDVIWEALQDYRENSIPEGDEMYDKCWDEICTAMAWISSALDIDQFAEDLK